MNIFFTSRRAAGVITVLVLMLTFLLGMLAGDVRERIISVTTKRLVPIYKVDTPEKKIAITIDGVWGAEKTSRILDIFDKYNVKITFFFGGYWLEKYPDMVREIDKRGHEIGNHTYTHPHCNSLAPEQLRQELEKTSLLIQDLTGKWPRFFRPPFGEYNNTVIRVAEEENYQVIQWSIDSLDWKEPGVHFIVKRVLEKAGPGEIVLMHNNGKHTADALEIIVPRLIEMGYKIVPLSELVYKDNYYIESHSGIQKRILSPRERK
ncbi:deacetylase [Anoxybacter fermentans]|uniref:Deacetylase n=1 Tax=Anoxybacter fermentans TaxID=1323375 RepID=A0A3S9SVS2_9FIRM|nr:polysaccharide deacetylase family protein [Anoxybacter fermentans]AZR72406.1 deacetylase [Anoxybacter fermentans]